MPDVQQVWCHENGGARLFHGVSIKQRYPGHAVQAGHIAAQCGASANACKYIVVLDVDVDVTGLNHLLWEMTMCSDRRNQSVHRRLMGLAGRPAAVAGEARQGRHDPFVAVIDACRPWAWRDKFPPNDTPSLEVTARRASPRLSEEEGLQKLMSTAGMECWTARTSAR